MDIRFTAMVSTREEEKLHRLLVYDGYLVSLNGISINGSLKADYAFSLLIFMMVY